MEENDVYRCTFDILFRTDHIYHVVNVGDAAPVKQHPYRLNPSKQQYLKEIKHLLENDFIEPSCISRSFPCILVSKPGGRKRMCTDYRKVNNVTKTNTFPIPRMDYCIDKLGKATYSTKFDLLREFWQVPLTERPKDISAFSTPKGLYQCQFMPLSMENSPATSQRLINNDITDLQACKAYINDVIIFSGTREKTPKNYWRLLQEIE